MPIFFDKDRFIFVTFIHILTILYIKKQKYTKLQFKLARNLL